MTTTETQTDWVIAELDESASSSLDRGAIYQRGKRIIDVALALVGLIAGAPLMLACALWIRLIDGAPVLYTQWRVGRQGWLFRIYKLRTMRQNAETPGESRWASAGDDRVLPGCQWMRKSHMDELPQLWNILRGQMSIVGPRPERPAIIEQLRPSMPSIDLRHQDKPGLTGLAQICNGYANDLDAARKKQFYDLRYLRRRGVVGDLKIICRTIPKLWDRSAC